MHRPSPILHHPENKEDSDSPLERHSRKCQVCCHPDRQAIEELFAHWVRPAGIARLYDIEWRALYRHAHALDLFRQRRGNMRSIMENILERGAEAPITADAILRTYRAYTSLADDGKWTEPPKHIIFSSQKIQTSQPDAQRQVMQGAVSAPGVINVIGQPPPDTQIANPEPQLTAQQVAEEAGFFRGSELSGRSFLIDSPAD